MDYFGLILYWLSLIPKITRTYDTSAAIRIHSLPWKRHVTIRDQHTDPFTWFRTHKFTLQDTHINHIYVWISMKIYEMPLRS